MNYEIIKNVIIIIINYFYEESNFTNCRLRHMPVPGGHRIYIFFINM